MACRGKSPGVVCRGFEENTSYKNCGDNIYDFNGRSIRQRPSFHKNCGNSCALDMENDLSSEYVLISNHYIYFVETPRSPGYFYVKSNRGYSSNYTEKERASFCDFINTLDFKKAIQGKPTECANNFDMGNTRPAE